MIRVYDKNRNLVYPASSGGVVTETDPVFSFWLSGSPNVSLFTNDAGYLTEVVTDSTLTGDGTLLSPLSAKTSSYFPNGW